MKCTLSSRFVLISIFLALFAGAVTADIGGISKEKTSVTSTNATEEMKTIGIIGGVSWYPQSNTAG